MSMFFCVLKEFALMYGALVNLSDHNAHVKHMLSLRWLWYPVNLTEMHFIYLFCFVVMPDMEWLNGPREMENMEVDIGYLPLMELNVTSSSMPAVVTEKVEGMTEPQVIRLADTALPEHPGLKDSVEDLKWTEEISMEDAARKLEVHMYKFKQVGISNKLFKWAISKQMCEAIFKNMWHHS